MEIRWVAHAWFQIKAGGTVIQIDPSNFDSKRLEALPVDVEKADLVLITHHHTDHCRREIVTLVSKQGTHILAPKPCAEKLFGGIVVMTPGEVFRDDGVSVRAVDAYNTPESASTVKSHKKGECLGYLMTAEGKTIYHAGDTDIIPEMVSFGAVDIALLPIGGTYTMDINDAVKAVAKIKPKIVIPMHSIDADPDEFVRKVRESSHTIVLRQGESFTF
jgi:L-ascorbate metabolism protein UlaG (beta-lactamase superfamily)